MSTCLLCTQSSPGFNLSQFAQIVEILSPSNPQANSLSPPHKLEYSLIANAHTITVGGSFLNETVVGQITMKVANFILYSQHLANCREWAQTQASGDSTTFMQTLHTRLTPERVTTSLNKLETMLQEHREARKNGAVANFWNVTATMLGGKESIKDDLLPSIERTKERLAIASSDIDKTRKTTNTAAASSQPLIDHNKISFE